MQASARTIERKRKGDAMKTQTRILMIAAILVLATGYLGLRSGNAQLANKTTPAVGGTP